MRPFSFVLAFAFFIVSPLTNSLSAKSPPASALPGIGTFTYTGSPVATDHLPVLATATLR